MILRSLLRHLWNSKMPKLESVPVVVVLGSTGVGKSQLAIEIAAKYNGEVISADSMQVYKNLDVTTNKVTDEEMAGVPHHMIDFLDPLESFTVVDFRNRVLPIVERLRKSGKTPVIVGGTNYYIESILWETLVADDHNASRLASCVQLCANSDEIGESLHARLKEVDPQRADAIHPNDRRKILRSLDIYEKRKRPHSEILKEQAAAGGVLGGPLRFKDAIIFWIRSDQKILEERLDARVDKMIERGLITEMLAFHKRYNQKREKPDYEVGILQSIGFKEFHRYLIASDEFRESKSGKKVFEAGLWLMKQRTKQYSKYQTKWIKKRFLGVPSRELPPLFALDGTDLEKWNENVRDKAFEIMEDTLNQAQSPRHQPLARVGNGVELQSQRVCVCGIICMTASTWEAHKNSRKHHRMMEHLEHLKDPEKAKERKRSKRRQSEEKSEGHKVEVGSEVDKLGNPSEKSGSTADSREKSTEDKAEERDLLETVEEVKGSEAIRSWKR